MFFTSGDVAAMLKATKTSISYPEARVLLVEERRALA